MAELSITKDKEGLYLPQVSKYVVKEFRATITNTNGVPVPKFRTKKELTATVQVPSLLQTARAVILGQDDFVI
jgi:hypothetical protein